jgi:hypothetical protein
MRLVILESPWSGGEEGQHLAYAQAAMRDALGRGESPYASHLLWAGTGILDDDKPGQRMLGMQSGFAWLSKADASVVYADLGVSKGMQEGIAQAMARGIPVEFRGVPGWAS